MTYTYFNGQRFSPVAILALHEGDTIMQEYGTLERVEKITAKILVSSCNGVTKRYRHKLGERVLVERW
jgi:hypothetical protein